MNFAADIVSFEYIVIGQFNMTFLLITFTDICFTLCKVLRMKFNISKSVYCTRITRGRKLCWCRVAKRLCSLCSMA